MTDEMTSIEKIWNTGHARLWKEKHEPGDTERTISFCEETGAVCVVKLRWIHDGIEVTCPFPATVLPLQSGVVLCDEWHFQGQPQEGTPPFTKHLRVLNPDGSLRLRVFAPTVDSLSKPDESWIEEPRHFPEYGVPFGAPAYDGYRDMVVEFDWQTGQMLRWTPAPWLRF